MATGPVQSAIEFQTPFHSGLVSPLIDDSRLKHWEEIYLRIEPSHGTFCHVRNRARRSILMKGRGPDSEYVWGALVIRARIQVHLHQSHRCVCQRVYQQEEWKSRHGDTPQCACDKTVKTHDLAEGGWRDREHTRVPRSCPRWRGEVAPLADFVRCVPAKLHRPDSTFPAADRAKHVRSDQSAS
jgi:hypothetical protein